MTWRHDIAAQMDAACAINIGTGINRKPQQFWNAKPAPLDWPGLNVVADFARLCGDEEVELPRDEWEKYYREAKALTRTVTTNPVQSTALRRWFTWDGIRFYYEIRPPTPDDEYVLCLEAAGWL